MHASVSSASFSGLQGIVKAEGAPCQVEDAEGGRDMHVDGEVPQLFRRSKRRPPEEVGDALVGRSVRKRFNWRWYHGYVKSYDADSTFYQVVYEDDDEEDLALRELKCVLLLKGEGPPVAAYLRDKRLSMEGMPDDVLEKIISHVSLSSGNQALRCMQVCKRWRDLVPTAITHLSVTRHCRLALPLPMAKFQNLESLRFDRTRILEGGWEPIFTALGAGCTHLCAAYFIRVTPMLTERDVLHLVSSLPNLRTLELHKCAHFSTLPNPSSLHSIQTLYLSHNWPFISLPPLSPLTSLLHLSLRASHRLTLPPFSSLSPLLLTLHISGSHSRTLPDLCPLSRLTSLTLSSFPYLRQVPPLDPLSALRSLSIIRCKTIASLPSLLPLSNLETLRLLWCAKLPATPSLADLPRLSDLDVRGCSDLMNVPGLDGARQLRAVNVMYSKVDPAGLGLSSLPRLESLAVSVNCERDASALAGLSTLKSLKVALTWGDEGGAGVIGPLPSLKDLAIHCVFARGRMVYERSALPEMLGLDSLSTLDIRDFPKVTTLDFVRGFARLERLAAHNVGVSALPDLSTLASLRTLSLSRCGGAIGDWLSPPSLSQLGMLSTTLTSLSVARMEQLATLEGLKAPTLRRLELERCPVLSKLVPIGELTALEALRLAQLPAVGTMPSLRALKQLTSLSVVDCAALRRMPALGMLPSLRELRVRECPELRGLPGVTLLSMLNSLVIARCRQIRDLAEIDNWATNRKPLPHELRISRLVGANEDDGQSEATSWSEGVGDHGTESDLEDDFRAYWYLPILWHLFNAGGHESSDESSSEGSDDDGEEDSDGSEEEAE